jgi:HEAT repeat protein
LRDIGQPAIAALNQALSSKDLRSRVGAAVALLEIEPQHPAALRSAIECLKQGDREIRHTAAAALTNDPGPHEDLTMADCVRLLSDKDEWVRQFAAAGIRNIGPPASLAAKPALVAALEDEDTDVQSIAIQALGDMGPAASELVPRLAKGLKSDETQMAVAEALGSIGPAAAAALPALEKLAKSLERDWKGVQKRARANGGEILDDDQEIADLVETVQQAMEAVQGKRPPLRPVPFSQATIPALVEEFLEPNLRTRISALRELVRRGENAAPAFIKLLTNPDTDIRATALSGLRELGPKASSAIPALIKGFADQDHYNETPMRQLYVLAIVAVGTASIPALKAAEKSRNQAVRQCVADALRKFEE